MKGQTESDLNMPAPVSEHLVMTLNGSGPATMYMDDYAKQFIQYAAEQTAPVLELGAAYGFVTIAALKAGATVIANDIEPRHLQILYNKTPEDCHERLTLMPGAFPRDLNLPAQSIAGCYIARMLGYLDPSQLQLGFEALFACLKTNAKLFIIASPPYKAIFRNTIPLYEQRIQENKLWPGYFTDLKQLVGGQYGPYVPDRLHFLDDIVLTRELERVGFVVEKAELFARKDLPRKALWDGREGVIAIGRKP